MDEDRCPDCGAPGVGGRGGCQALFDALGLRAYSDLRYASVQSLTLDAYCMQHLERYCRSAKSYAAHLTRLCCGLEYGGDPVVYRAIQQWLNGPVDLEKPPILSQLGRMTLADVQAAGSGDEYVRLVRAWAGVVWDAYAVQHDLARGWIQAALAAQGRAEPRRGRRE